MLTCCCNSVSLWDSYVRSTSAGTPFHLCGWRSIIEDIYGHAAYFLSARVESDGRQWIAGVLPLVHFCCPRKESRLVSLPFLDFTGLLADDATIEQFLFQEALALAERVGAVHLELRQDHPLSFLQEKNFAIPNQYQHQAHGFKVGLRRPLPASSEELWQSIGSKVRNQVRKARHCRCCDRVGGVELLDLFYAVFSRNMRDLGSPVHSRAFFTEILRQFGKQAAIILVEGDDEPLAAALVLQMGDTLYNPWASSLRAFRPLCPNMLLYWRMLAYGCEQGLDSFDFGRSSPGAPAYRFKKKWGAEVRPLTWHIFSRKPYSWNPERESLVIEPWKELDLDLSSATGPALRRWISL
jgi:FemAB-related protein (PEP-CTERM system-associated)